MDYLWRESAKVLKLYLDSLQDRCFSQHCKSFWYTKQFHKAHLADLVRDQVKGDVFKCLYYAELYLIESYIRLQQKEILQPLVKSLGKFVKTHYEIAYLQKDLMPHVYKEEVVRLFQTYLLKARFYLKVNFDDSGCTRSLYKAHRLFQNNIRGFDKNANLLMISWLLVAIDLCIYN